MLVTFGDNLTVDEEVMTMKEMTYAANGALEMQISRQQLFVLSWHAPRCT